MYKEAPGTRPSPREMASNVCLALDCGVAAGLVTLAGGVLRTNTHSDIISFSSSPRLVC